MTFCEDNKSQPSTHMPQTPAQSNPESRTADPASTFPVESKKGTTRRTSLFPLCTTTGSSSAAPADWISRATRAWIKISACVNVGSGTLAAMGQCNFSTTIHHERDAIFTSEMVRQKELTPVDNQVRWRRKGCWSTGRPSLRVRVPYVESSAPVSERSSSKVNRPVKSNHIVSRARANVRKA